MIHQDDDRVRLLERNVERRELDVAPVYQIFRELVDVRLDDQQ